MNEKDYGRIMESLYTRELCKGGYYMSAAQAREQHLDMIASAPGGKELVEEEEKLLVEGNQYFADGYRLHESPRQIRGLSWTIPEDALTYRLVSAGHIATSEAERLQWLTNRSEKYDPFAMYDQPAGPDANVVLPEGLRMPQGYRWTADVEKRRYETQTEFEARAQRAYYALHLEDPNNYPLYDTPAFTPQPNPHQDAIDELREVQDELRDIVERLQTITRGLPKDVRQRVDIYVIANIECATTSDTEYGNSYNLDKAIAELEDAD